MILSSDSFGADRIRLTARPESFGAVTRCPHGADVYKRQPSLSPADTARGLALDNLGNVLVTGGGNHNYGAFQYETFKLDTNGNYLWTNFYPSVVTGNSIATSIVVDLGNNAYVTG